MSAFDYIVVGGGSAGCVLANRLSADGSAKVLLVEAGKRGRHPYLRIPLGVGLLHKRGMFDWGYRSEPEDALGGRTLPAIRGKVLGGSSSVNMMAHTRGNPRDFDRWAANGAPGWSHADVLPFFRRSERWERGASAHRGGDGPVAVRVTPFRDPLSDAWLAAAGTAGFPIVDDYNADSQTGFGRSQFAIGRGRRASSAAAYLDPVRGRPNLTVRSDTLVTRVVIEQGRAVGIQTRADGGADTIRAEREVILSAGTFDTPKLLMLSGVGPAAHLRELAIPVQADLPVGDNLQDYAAVQVAWRRLAPGPFMRALRADRMALAMVRAFVLGTGPATMLPSGLHGFVKLDDGTDVPQIEFMFRNAPGDAHLWLPLLHPGYHDEFGIRPTLLHPFSRGDVRLRSADAADPPRIRFRLLSDPRDFALLRRGVRLGRELGESAALASFRGEELLPGADAGDDVALDRWIRRTVVTANHPVGTCAMGTGDGAVIDPELRVRGVAGLRVVDASAMPDLVSAHINAAVLMIAERAAAVIAGAETILPQQRREAA